MQSGETLGFKERAKYIREREVHCDACTTRRTVKERARSLCGDSLVSRAARGAEIIPT